jgi:hypothetical protein
MLKTDRREYRRIARHGLDRAPASPRDIDKNLRKPARFEEANTGGEAMTSVYKV